jgi:catalase
MQLPINRPHAPVNDMLRDGMHQTAVHTGIAPYRPNDLDGGKPKTATARQDAYVQTARPVEGPVVREAPISFADHFSQATLFYRSLSPVEQAHVIDAITFELGKCYEKSIKERELEVLAKVDSDLCERVAAGLGLGVPQGTPAEDVVPSPALSQLVATPGPIDGRRIAVVADAKSDLAGVAKLREAAQQRGAQVLVLAAVGGELRKGSRTEIVERTFATARSIEFDAVVIAGNTAPVSDPQLMVLLQEAYRHCKPLGAWGSGAQLLIDAGVPTDAPGVLVGDTMVKAYSAELFAALGMHRVWERDAAYTLSAAGA